MASPMLDAALRLAALGWRVHPCEPRGKRPLLPRWPERATDDPEALRSWWTRWPDANPAVATGEGSGLVVLDIDGDEGWRSMERLEELHGGALPPTLKVATSRGEHWYFRHPGGHVGNGTAIHGFDGLDVRADGGYVLGAGSVHPSGHVYEFVVEPNCPLGVLRELVSKLPEAPAVLCGTRTTSRARAATVAPPDGWGWLESAAGVSR